MPFLECPQKVRHFIGGIFMSRKIKHDYNFKKAVVKEVVNEGLSAYAVSFKYNLGESMVRRWVSFYRAHGSKGLKPIRNKYSPKFKVKVIQKMKENSLSFQQTCVLFKIPSSETLVKWVKVYNEKGREGLSIENRGRIKSMPRKPKKPMTREEQLLDELADLKAENAYLKKLHALVQSEKEKEEKRKSSRN
ncbi:hypothetical protein JRG66_14875 [Salinimicrobium tongyeongense]|uniref:Insertion element IS150 protein InsJ-like helix-turn-helix domain-containing protein n=1 Tax=Salinimicrobium tongyeongense TaxID=2809707 RepID=A0ABY6NRU6_9FLAO|nr:helix-turn-helix domain-containing protein [Salinimicrobium tongyeongense]UZH55213.1 hypothetical protein JRG66_14875 [Salinimicrobium tongyeongense]